MSTEERIVEPVLGVSTSNWIAAPYNRWGFNHVDRLARTARISRGGGPTNELVVAERGLETLRFAHEGAEISLADMLERTYTDGFLVLHDGVVVFERYFGAMASGDCHLLMSVSKSLTSILCGVLVGHGRLDPRDHVVDHVDELRGTAWDGCTVQHLLDMRVGIEWDHEIDEYATLDVSGYRTHVRTDLPADIAAWIRSVRRGGEPGQCFSYTSLATDVLGRVIEAAASEPFAQLFSREVWSRIGAENDAYVIVDKEGFPVVEGGICTTLRDLARIGQMCLMGGIAFDGREVVRSQWLSRLRRPNNELIDEFRRSLWYDASRPDAFYHDCWWIRDAVNGIHMAAGMNGQALLIHHPSRSVVAKLSSFPGARDAALSSLQEAGMTAVCQALVAG